MSGDASLAAFSTRNGGISAAPLNSLNFSISQGDSQRNVRTNYKILGAELGLDPLSVVTCKQIHGDNVEILDAIPSSSPVADATITSAPGIFLGIKTADCLPILLLDSNKRIAAAVHAGWRGTVLRITRNVIRLMQSRFRCRPSDILVALGPAIGPCCYEVDDAVLVPFRREIPDPERFITFGRQADQGVSYRLNLAEANCWELTAEGIPPQNIRRVELCTCCNPDLFFSHRRDGAASGRHIALVGFRV